MVDRFNDALFLFDQDGLVDVYPSIDIAESNLEAIDVVDGEFEDAFAIDGERLFVTAVDHASPVVIEGTGERDLDSLRRCLVGAGQRNGFDGSNPDLAVVANEILRNDWKVRWPRWPGWLDRWAHGDGPASV